MRSKTTELDTAKKSPRSTPATASTPAELTAKTAKTAKTPKTPTADAEAPTPWDSQFIALSRELRAELDAVPTEQLIVPNVDIAAAVRTARSVLPVLAALRPRAASIGAEFDMKLYDRLGAYADLLHYAHGGYLAAQKTPDDVAATYAELVELRDFMLGWSAGLVASKLLTQSFIDAVRAGTGFDDACNDVVALTNALRALWPQIEGKTMIEAAHLDRGDALVRKLSTSLAMREGRAEGLSKRANDRQLAFTLFFRAYSEARAVVTFLRRHERDADKLVPSLYEGRNAGRKPEAEPEPEPVAPQPANPSADPKPAPNAKPAVDPGAPKPGESLPPMQSSPFASPVEP